MITAMIRKQNKQTNKQTKIYIQIKIKKWKKEKKCQHIYEA